MKERIIKVRLIILIASFMAVIGAMTLCINAEVNKIDRASEDYKEKLIRFHVIANSDNNEDQELKLKVRDNIISYLKPKLENSDSISESEEIIKSEYENLYKISRETVKENGYDYDISVGIEYSNFPTKQYSNVVLPAGEYKALKVIIGEGKGKNWWCVMFPPLCFVDEENGIIDEETDSKLQSVLDEEEYELITSENKTEVNTVKLKFKIVEVVKSIF